MRNLFLVLLLANICMGLWLYGEEKAASRAPAKHRAATSNLLLLSELPAAPPAGAEVTEQAAAERTEPLVVAATAEPITAPGAATAQNGAAPDAAPKSAPEPPPVADTPTPALLTEPVVIAEPPKPADECFTLGPFVERPRAERVAAVLAQAGAQTQIRTSQEPQPYGYRVYIPPLSSKARAYELVKELRDKGVKDYFVITNPNDKVNGISLGLFRKKTGALKRVARLRNLNYSASMEVRYKDREIHWLDYRATPGAVDDNILREAREGTEAIQHLPRDCQADDRAGDKAG